MATDHIRYDLLAQKALRGVVRTVLADAAKNGLPGDHHFYIAFDTQMPGVRISPQLHEQYAQEMTIILQHQFWDLKVTNDGFEVGLSFGGVPERVGVPFDAIKSFFDPSVQFGLQFQGEGEDAVAELPATEEEKPTRKKTPRSDTPLATSPKASPAAAEEEPAKSPPSGGGEVVSLDRFRKK
jgi:hypothetical protein